MTARILVTGGGGMLARALKAQFSDEAELLTRGELDITNLDAVMAAVRGRSVVINTAAFTAVDDAESDEATAFAINATGAENVARAAAAADARLIHLSTDYVFDGLATTPYREDSETEPTSAYGRSKRAGERAVLAAHPTGSSIVRTAWLYGAGGPNFVRTMIDHALHAKPVSVVRDQIGQPTWTVDLAHRIRYVLDAPVGVYHGVNSGQCSWWDLAVAIYSAVGADTDLVEPTLSTSYVRPASRPAYSVLGDDAARNAGIPAMRNWREALIEALATDFRA